MEVPAAVAARPTPVVVAEPGARTRVAVTLAIVVVAVLLPSAAAILLRPENPGEGYAFLVAAVALAWWQLRRLRRSGVAVGRDGIARAGDPVVPWAQVTDIRWDTTRTAGRGTQPLSIHRLVADTVDGQEVGLTRWPATDEQAAHLARALRGSGVDLLAPAAPRRW